MMLYPWFLKFDYTISSCIGGGKSAPLLRSQVGGINLIILKNYFLPGT
tara:strand:- start:439 stop:582 length:144 start_codon:yes stop_codon:yes gene_type:complete